MAGWVFLLDNIVVEEPIGWDGIEFTAKRMDSHGIDQPFSTEVIFYGNGAQYIKSIYDQHFINQPIAIEIASDVDVNGTPYIFSGFLNLAIYEEKNSCDTDSFGVAVGIIDDNFREDFKARQDIDIDLLTTTDLGGGTINPLSLKTIRLHKQDLFLEARGGSYSERYVASVPWYQVVLVPIYWKNSDFKEAYGSTIDTTQITLNWNGGQWGQSPIFKNNSPITRYLKIEFEITVTIENNHPNNYIDVYVYFTRVNGNVRSNNWFLLNTTLNANQTQTWVLGGSFNSVEVPVGWTLNYAVEAGYVGNPYPATIKIHHPTTLIITEINAAQYASTTQCLTIEQWLRRAIYVMTGFPDKLISNVFSESGGGCYWNNALTNGIYLRNIPAAANNNNNQLRTSWKTVFDDLDKIFCLGWAFEWTGFEWKIRVEPREYFYQNAVTAEFNDVDSVIQSVKADILRNKFQIGYTDRWKNIQISGALSVFTDRTYFVKNRAMTDNSSANMDIRSNIIAEGIAIEFYRRMSDITYGASTSDRPNDYDIFLIWLNPLVINVAEVQNSEFKLPEESGAMQFQKGTVSFPSGRAGTINGIISNRYNLLHTPARVAYRWWKVLGMHTHGLTVKKLLYQVGQYQTAFVSTVNYYGYSLCTIFQWSAGSGGLEISEDSDIDSTNLKSSQYLFKPVEITFKYPQSLCDFLYLSEQSAYGRIKVTMGNLITFGFITDIANQPEDSAGGTTSFKLLASNTTASDFGPYDESWNNAYL